MDDADRHRLRGTYQTPLFAFGQTVRCRVRGAVVIVGLSEQDRARSETIGNNARGASVP